jgi:hypothetical protein
MRCEKARKAVFRPLGPRRDTCDATRRLPVWVTAGKGPIAPGRSRGQNQQVPQLPAWMIVLIAPSSRRHSREKCLKPRSRPGITAASLPAARIFDIPIAQEHVASLLWNIGSWCDGRMHAQSSMCGMAGLKLNSLVKSHVLV